MGTAEESTSFTTRDFRRVPVARGRFCGGWSAWAGAIGAGSIGAGATLGYTCSLRDALPVVKPFVSNARLARRPRSSREVLRRVAGVGGRDRCWRDRCWRDSWPRVLSARWEQQRKALRLQRATFGASP